MTERYRAIVHFVDPDATVVAPAKFVSLLASRAVSLTRCQVPTCRMLVCQQDSDLCAKHLRKYVLLPSLYVAADEVVGEGADGVDVAATGAGGRPAADPASSAAPSPDPIFSIGHHRKRAALLRRLRGSAPSDATAKDPAKP